MAREVVSLVRVGVQPMLETLAKSFAKSFDKSFAKSFDKSGRPGP